MNKDLMTGAVVNVHLDKFGEYEKEEISTVPDECTNVAVITGTSVISVNALELTFMDGQSRILPAGYVSCVDGICSSEQETALEQYSTEKPSVGQRTIIDPPLAKQLYNVSEFLEKNMYKEDVKRYLELMIFEAKNGADYDVIVGHFTSNLINAANNILK